MWTIYNDNIEVIYFIYMHVKTHLAAIVAIPLIFTNPEMTEVQKLFSNINVLNVCDWLLFTDK